MNNNYLNKSNTSCLYKNGILIKKATTSFKICNNEIDPCCIDFFIRKEYTCHGVKIIFCVKNNSSRVLNNVKIRFKLCSICFNYNEQWSLIDLGYVCPCQCVSRCIFLNKCCNHQIFKLLAELSIENNVVKRECILV